MLVTIQNFVARYAPALILGNKRIFATMAEPHHRAIMSEVTRGVARYRQHGEPSRGSLFQCPPAIHSQRFLTEGLTLFKRTSPHRDEWAG